MSLDLRQPNRDRSTDCYSPEGDSGCNLAPPTTNASLHVLKWNTLRAHSRQVNLTLIKRNLMHLFLIDAEILLLESPDCTCTISAVRKKGHLSKDGPFLHLLFFSITVEISSYKSQLEAGYFTSVVYPL